MVDLQYLEIEINLSHFSRGTREGEGGIDASQDRPAGRQAPRRLEMAEDPKILLLEGRPVTTRFPESRQVGQVGASRGGGT